MIGKNTGGALAGEGSTTFGEGVRIYHGRARATALGGRGGHNTPDLLGKRAC